MLITQLIFQDNAFSGARSASKGLLSDQRLLGPGHLKQPLPIVSAAVLLFVLLCFVFSYFASPTLYFALFEIKKTRLLNEY